MAEETTGLTTDEAAAEEEASDKKPSTRPLDYVMVSHMGYSRETKTHRAARAGGRRQRFMLDTGRRIKAKGDRYTEVSFTDVLKNFNTLLAGVRGGAIQVCRPDNLEPITMEQFLDLGEQLAKDFKFDHKVDETLLEPLFGSDLTDKKVYVEKPKDKDVTKPDLGQSEVLAKVDQHEAEAKGEANPPPEGGDTGLIDDEGNPADAEAEAGEAEAGGESEEGLTEEQMMEMSVKELQKLAKDYGVKKPEKLHTKKELVDAIMAAASKQED